MPRGICSWDFVLDGDGHRAALELQWLSEQGAITVDGVRFDVRKHGVFSGHWTLEHAGEEVASAQKTSPFTRTFAIQEPRGDLALRPTSPLGRSFDIERAGELIATIVPTHLFTRRATIGIVADKKWDWPTIAFAFWLVVLMWRRAAQSNSGGGGG